MKHNNQNGSDSMVMDGIRVQATFVAQGQVEAIWQIHSINKKTGYAWLRFLKSKSMPEGMKSGFAEVKLSRLPGMIDHFVEKEMAAV